MEDKTNVDGRKVLVALFTDKHNAEKAYDDLKDRGYDAEEINVVMSSTTRDKLYGDKDGEETTEMGNKALEGAGTGSAIGGVIGGIAGAIAAIGTNLLIPGLGLIIFGPLAAGLAGAGAGGLTGGIIGGLVGAGIPEEHAKVIDEGLKNGRIMISVHPHDTDDIVELTNKWRSYQAEEIYS